MGTVAALHRRTGDVALFACVLAMVALGLVMVYSASSVVAYERLQDSAYFFKRQTLWAALGLAALGVAWRTHYARLGRLAVPVLLVALVLMGLVLLPGIGVVAGGARRWLVAGPLRFQPVELAKLAMVLYVAQFATRRGPGMRDFRRGVLPPLLVTGLLGALALRQPDMGSALVLGAAMLVMLYLGGARVLHLGLVVAAALPVLAAAVLLADYRMARVVAFLNPWRDPQGTGFHIIQALLAFGSGGLLGSGLGASRQKFFYLPERHTDFIFAILGEELGLLGTLGLLALFGLFAYRGLRIAAYAPDRFSSLLAAGITTSVTGQALLNMGVATGSLPVTGVPLPFVSFGGSAMVTTMIQVGVLLNISRYARPARPAVSRPTRLGRPMAGTGAARAVTAP
ncbi:MAG: putative lipid II flippase FtsW [Armatimonadota bacterium]|nr:putative lipid II flippase FtsW [Armatimonadota bacterium]MDR7534352.1 putative lipid II flippase FtsW [Armatimonadota bacterium]MDR7536012.1 putative lipid II flippase FtsW [Armatimonadota bacterium]